MPKFSSDYQPPEKVKGDKCYNAVLTAQMVKDMRRLHKEDGLCVPCIAKIFDRKYMTVRAAIDGSNWKHVKENAPIPVSGLGEK
jgi:hypothetical protein